MNCFMLFLVYALTACLQLLRLSAKHKGRAVLSPDFMAVIRLPHHGINLFRQSSKFPFMAVGAKIQLGFSANRFSSTEKWSLIFDFRAEVFPPPPYILILKVDSSYLFKNKIRRGAVLN